MKPSPLGHGHSPRGRRQRCRAAEVNHPWRTQTCRALRSLSVLPLFPSGPFCRISWARLTRNSSGLSFAGQRHEDEPRGYDPQGSDIRTSTARFKNSTSWMSSHLGGDLHQPPRTMRISQLRVPEYLIGLVACLSDVRQTERPLRFFTNSRKFHKCDQWSGFFRAW